MLYGKDWKKMQPLIKSRSLVQIRTHAQKVFKKIGLKKALMMSTNKRLKVDAPVGTVMEGTAAPSKVRLCLSQQLYYNRIINTLCFGSKRRTKTTMEMIRWWVPKSCNCFSR